MPPPGECLTGFPPWARGRGFPKRPPPARSAGACPESRRPSRGPRGSGWATRSSRGSRPLLSAAVYATLIVTFGVQGARRRLSMAPTLEDHDRLIVNKLVYELGDPRPGDIVMLYYPLNPEKDVRESG